MDRSALWRTVLALWLLYLWTGSHHRVHGKCSGQWAIHACGGGNGKRSDHSMELSEKLQRKESDYIKWLKKLYNEISEGLIEEQREEEAAELGREIDTTLSNDLYAQRAVDDPSPRLPAELSRDPSTHLATGLADSYLNNAILINKLMKVARMRGED